MGIKPGYKILDFGCGWGSNAIAMAKVVSPSGCVYALEKDRDSIKKLLETADSKVRANLKLIESRNKTSIPISDMELDGALLYDVIHDYYFDQAERKKLFLEIQRIIRKKGLLSVLPHHIDENGINIIKGEIMDAGFTFRNIIRDTILHDSTLIEDTVFNFIRD
jgi:ubiquinone/menaquinone biosynthesis C-methylase UbiE